MAPALTEVNAHYDHNHWFIWWATHATFKPFICSQGLSFFPVEGDPPNLLKTEAGRAWLDTGGNPILFFHGLSRTVGPLLQQAIIDCWNACQNVDAIVFSQLGICIAYPIVENLEVPFCLANTIPLTPTRAFACPFFPPAPIWLPTGSDFYNRSSYFLTVQALWKLVQPAVNRVRREILNLPPLPSRWLVDRLRQQRIHFLYGYSSSFLPQPPDWSDWNHVTGYWFLRRPSNWQPPADLVDFLAAGPPPVYVGFGSMNNRNPEEVTEMVLKIGFFHKWWRLCIMEELIQQRLDCVRAYPRSRSPSLLINLSGDNRFLSWVLDQNLFHGKGCRRRVWQLLSMLPQMTRVFVRTRGL